MTRPNEGTESIRNTAGAAIRRVFKNWRDYVAALGAYDSGASTVAYVQVLGKEVHASSELFADDPRADRRVWECDSLGQVLDRNGLERVDLLKADCEGGEYDIFTDVTRIPRLRTTLGQAGYQLIAQNQLLHALRGSRCGERPPDRRDPSGPDCRGVRPQRTSAARRCRHSRRHRPATTAQVRASSR